MSASASQTMREANAPLWQALVAHPFPAAMAAGSLPPEVFRYYITQNLFYLPEYAKVLALGVAAASTEAMASWFASDLENIIHTEIPANRELLAKANSLCGPVGGRAARALSTAAPATVAYTNWLLTQGHRADEMAIATAILPCAWSYGEIGLKLLPDCVEHPLYKDWIGFFASAEYHSMVAQMIEDLDLHYATLPEATFKQLTQVFATACRLERLFWDDALERRTWPDLARLDHRVHPTGGR